jgi:hypothetical protein
VQQAREPRRRTRTRTHEDHQFVDRHPAWTGSYGLADVEGTPLILTGVFISDRPLSANDGAPLNGGGAPGHGVFEVTIPDDVDFERLISRTACREFSSQHPMARLPDLADDPNTRVGAHARTRPLVGRWEVCLANEQAQREVRDSFKDGRTPESRLAQREPLSPAIRHLPD